MCVVTKVTKAESAEPVNLLPGSVTDILDMSRSATVARDHWAQVKVKQRKLAMLATELRSVVEACYKGTCATCIILRALSAHRR
jgi:hypothetical protein